MNIVIAESVLGAKALFASFGSINIIPDDAINAETLRETQVLIIRSKTRVDKTLLEKTPLQFVATATAGFDHLDTEALDQQGIVWAHAPGCNATAVVEYVLAALSSLALRDCWQWNEKILGIVGHGHVGKQLAIKAQALGMQVLINDPPLAEINPSLPLVTLEEVLSESDIVSLHVPLIKQGRHATVDLIDEKALRQLSKHSTLIQTSRGGVVNESALLTALEKQQLSDVVIDVWQNEPDFNKKLAAQAWLATPHIAGHTLQACWQGTWQAFEAFCQWQQISINHQLNKIPNSTKKTLIQAQHQSIAEIILKAYPIQQDHQQLAQAAKQSPQGWGQVRKHYAKRLAFCDYLLYSEQVIVGNVLQEIGFINNSQIGDPIPNLDKNHS